jgi:hypothetical protein
LSFFGWGEKKEGKTLYSLILTRFPYANRHPLRSKTLQYHRYGPDRARTTAASHPLQSSDMVNQSVRRQTA